MMAIVQRLRFDVKHAPAQGALPSGAALGLRGVQKLGEQIPWRGNGLVEQNPAHRATVVGAMRDDVHEQFFARHAARVAIGEGE